VDLPLGPGRADFVGCAELVPVAIGADIIIVEQLNINLIKSISTSPIYIPYRRVSSLSCSDVASCASGCRCLKNRQGLLFTSFPGTGSMDEQKPGKVQH